MIGLPVPLALPQFDSKELVNRELNYQWKEHYEMSWNKLAFICQLVSFKWDSQTRYAVSSICTYLLINELQPSCGVLIVMNVIEVCAWILHWGKSLTSVSGKIISNDFTDALVNHHDQFIHFLETEQEIFVANDNAYICNCKSALLFSATIHNHPQPPTTTYNHLQQPIIWPQPPMIWPQPPKYWLNHPKLWPTFKIQLSCRVELLWWISERLTQALVSHCQRHRRRDTGQTRSILALTNIS